MINCVVFIITAISLCSLIALTLAYAVIKYPLGESFSFSSSFIGILDGFFSFGRLLGSGFLVLYKIKSLKKVYTVQAIVQGIISGTIFAIIFIVPSSLAEELLIIAIITLGFSRSFVTVPRIIVTDFSNPNEDQFALAFWSKMVPIGDILTLVFSKQLLQFGIKQNIVFLIYLGVFFAATFLQQCVIPDSNQQQRQQVAEEQSAIEYIKETLAAICIFLKVPKHLLWYINSSVISTVYFLIMMWSPYYFQKIGFHDESALISMMFPIALLLAIVLNYFMSFCPSQRDLFIVSCYILFIGCLIGMLYLGYEKSNLVWYLILMGGFGFFISPGVTIITAVDIGTLTEGNPRLRKQVFFFEAMSRQVVMMIFNILVGWLLDKDLKSFIYILLGLSVAFTIIHIGRVCCYGPIQNSQRRRQEEEESDSL